jgi:hypothetical protein
LSIEIELRTCVQGYLSRNPGQRTSLLIFSVHFAWLDTKVAFNRVMLDPEFEEISESSTQTAKTAIVAHAPFNTEEKQREKNTAIQRHENEGTIFKIEINIIGSKGGANTESTWENRVLVI